MIDIHSHILPGVDDGARDLEEALEMARIAVADGTTHLFATPHHVHFTPLSRQDVECRVAALQKELDAAAIPLTVLPGHEVRLYPAVLEDWAAELAGPLANSRYVLAEPDFQLFDETSVELALKLMDMGYVPVLAHPERIVPIQEDLALIEPILERGGLVQITANNLALNGQFGDEATREHSNIFTVPARETALELLRRGWAHIIASDAHNTGFRRPSLVAACEAAAAVVGVEMATAMVTTIPEAILNDQPLPIL